MIGYVTLGTNDLDRAAAFYDAIASEMGFKRFIVTEKMVTWGGRGSPGFGVIKPYDGAVASVGNGAMVALQCKDRAQVDRVYAIARELGGGDEGAPGERWPGFYAGYFRDLDGNKLNAFIMGG